jgi:hypothetical protein
MKAELTYTFESPEELAEFTAKLARPSVNYVVTPGGVVDVAAIPPSQHVPVDMESVAVAETLRPTKVRKNTKTAGPDVPVDPTSEEQVRQAITAVNDNFGLVAARKVMRQFNANRIPDLKPEQYADFVKACNAVK